MCMIINPLGLAYRHTACYSKPLCKSNLGEIIQFSSGSLHLSTILLKDSHLFKIIELVISFCFNKISNSTILNKCNFFSAMMDHVTCPPYEPYIQTPCVMSKVKNVSCQAFRKFANFENPR